MEELKTPLFYVSYVTTILGQQTERFIKSKLLYIIEKMTSYIYNSKKIKNEKTGKTETEKKYKSQFLGVFPEDTEDSDKSKLEGKLEE